MLTRVCDMARISFTYAVSSLGACRFLSLGTLNKVYILPQDIFPLFPQNKPLHCSLFLSTLLPPFL